jgi:hypothetical protein
LRWSAIVSETIGNGWETVADKPAKKTDAQAAMQTHLSQSTGIGAFDGQHGISLAISSAMPIADISDGDISSAIARSEPCEDVAAMTGRETGASARPAIISTASSRRMVDLRCTRADFSHLYGSISPDFD